MGALVLVGIGVVIGLSIGAAIALAVLAPPRPDDVDDNPFF